MPKLSVSIVTHFPDIAVLEDVIAALGRAVSPAGRPDPRIDAELVVVDNSVNAAVASDLRRLLDRYDKLKPHLVIEPRNLGFGTGHNRAIGKLTSDFHLVLNPDAVMAPDAVQHALAYLEANPHVGLVVPRVSGSDGAQVFLCKRYPSLLDLLLRGFAPMALRKLFRRRLEHYEMRDITRDEAVRGIPIASGCFMFFRTDLLQRLGGFDSRFFMYFEDFDLCMRLHAQADIAYVPAVRIVHTGGNASRKGFAHIRMFSVSAIRLFLRWGWKWI